MSKFVSLVSWDWMCVDVLIVYQERMSVCFKTLVPENKYKILLLAHCTLFWTITFLCITITRDIYQNF